MNAVSDTALDPSILIISPISADGADKTYLVRPIPPSDRQIIRIDTLTVNIPQTEIFVKFVYTSAACAALAIKLILTQHDYTTKAALFQPIDRISPKRGNYVS